MDFYVILIILVLFCEISLPSCLISLLFDLFKLFQNLFSLICNIFLVFPFCKRKLIGLIHEMNILLATFNLGF